MTKKLGWKERNMQPIREAFNELFNELEDFEMAISHKDSQLLSVTQERDKFKLERDMWHGNAQSLQDDLTLAKTKNANLGFEITKLKTIMVTYPGEAIYHIADLKHGPLVWGSKLYVVDGDQLREFKKRLEELEAIGPSEAFKEGQRKNMDAMKEEHRKMYRATQSMSCEIEKLHEVITILRGVINKAIDCCKHEAFGSVRKLLEKAAKCMGDK